MLQFAGPTGLYFLSVHRSRWITRYTGYIPILYATVLMTHRERSQHYWLWTEKSTYMYVLCCGVLAYEKCYVTDVIDFR